MSDEEVERLKKHKLPQVDGRLHLPVAGQRDPSPPPEGVVAEEGVAPAERITDVEGLRARIVDVLKTVHDPEIPLNIYDLGLIYGVDVTESGEVEVRMTLTAPACPVAGSLVEEVAHKVAHVPGVAKSNVELVWDPPWTPERLSDEARLELGLL